MSISQPQIPPITIIVDDEQTVSVFQGDFNLGKLQMSKEGLQALLSDFQTIRSVYNWSIKPGKPDNPPPPIPKPSCSGPFCPGGIPFKSAEELIQSIHGPLTTPGREGFEFKNGNIILISTPFINNSQISKNQ